MHEEHLSLTEQFASDGLGDRVLVLFADVGQDRLPRRGRRVDHREVADPGQAHLEGPRNRTRGECEDVNADAELFHRLFV